MDLSSAQDHPHDLFPPTLPHDQAVPQACLSPPALLQPFLSGRAWCPAPTRGFCPGFCLPNVEKNQKNKLADALTKNKVTTTVLARPSQQPTSGPFGCHPDSLGVRACKSLSVGTEPQFHPRAEVCQSGSTHCGSHSG